MNLKEGILNQADGFQWSPGLLLQRKCDCGNHALTGACDDCARKKGSLQRKASGDFESSEAPSIVNEVLRSPGQALDPATRAYMEPRFRHDFSKVRVHTDDKAADSARAVDSLAYTVGRDIVFGRGQYAPWSTQGQKLMAHELTHVVQQGDAKWSGGALNVGASDTPHEQEADRARGGEIVSSAPSTPVSAGTIQRDEGTDYGGLFLRANEHGRIEFLYGSPNLPVTGRLGGGFRCENGRCQFVGGQNPSNATNRTYTIQEALDLLGGGGARPGGPAASQCSPDRSIPYFTGVCCPVGMTWDRTTSTCAPWSVPVCPAPEERTPTGTCCPTGERWDYARLRCAPPRVVAPQLQLPDLTLPTRPRFRFGTIESTTLSHFDSDGSGVPSRHQAALDHLASLLNIYTDVEVHIEGHTDSTAGDAHNQRLSVNRAEAVRAELIARNVVNPGRLVVQGFGKQQLQVQPERNDEDRATNRRVDVWFHIPPRQPIGSELRLTPPSMPSP